MARVTKKKNEKVNIRNSAYKQSQHKEERETDVSVILIQFNFSPGLCPTNRITQNKDER